MGQEVWLEGRAVLRARHPGRRLLTHGPAGVWADHVLQDPILIPPTKEFTGTALTFYQMFLF